MTRGVSIRGQGFVRGCPSRIAAYTTHRVRILIKLDFQTTRPAILFPRSLMEFCFDSNRSWLSDFNFLSFAPLNLQSISMDNS